jgi:deferrochelatase/peroxidase EfeB
MAISRYDPLGCPVGLTCPPPAHIRKVNARDAGSATLLNGEGGTATVTATDEHVIPTGGDYFFSPSISANATVLAAS